MQNELWSVPRKSKGGLKAWVMEILRVGVFQKRKKFYFTIVSIVSLY